MHHGIKAGGRAHASAATFHTLAEFPFVYCVSGSFEGTLNESERVLSASTFWGFIPISEPWKSGKSTRKLQHGL